MSDDFRIELFAGQEVAVGGNRAMNFGEFVQEYNRLRAEVDALRAALRHAANEMKLCDEELTRLRAEVEALRADAERYRWLREAPPNSVRWSRWEVARYSKYGRAPLYGPDLDVAIDAAPRNEG